MLKRRLITLLSFIIAIAIAAVMFYYSPKKEKLTPQEYFCAVCVEAFILKSKSFQFSSETVFSEPDLFMYLPAQLELTEKAVLLEILNRMSKLGKGKGTPTPFEQLGKSLFEAWGRERLNIKLRIPHHGIFKKDEGLVFPRIHSWPHFYFSSLQSVKTENENLAFILLHPMQTDFDVFLSLAHQLFYLFDPIDLAQVENPNLVRVLKSFRAYLVELHLFDLHRQVQKNKRLSQYRGRNYNKYYKKISKKDYAPLFEWTLEQLYPGDWTKHSITEAIQTNIFVAPLSQEESRLLRKASDGELSLRQDVMRPLSLVGRFVPAIMPLQEQLSLPKFSQLFSLKSSEDGLLFQFRFGNEHSPDNNPVFLEYESIRKEIWKYMRSKLDEEHSDDNSEVINSYLKGVVPEVLQFDKSLKPKITPDMIEEI